MIHEVFREYTDLIEPLSLDEAYLDVTHNKKGIPSATLIAKAIRKEIKVRIGLTASAGISVNKFIAKVASDYHKPDGITLVGPEKVDQFLDQLSIEKFFGVGKVTAEKMKSLGITNGKELKKWSKEALIDHFGKAGGYYFEIVRGNDERKVNPNRERKSLGAENTFDYDLKEKVDIKLAIEPIAQTVFRRLQKTNKYGKTITLKVKFSDFNQITRSMSAQEEIDSLDQILELTFNLLDQVEWENFAEGVRLLGITCSNFERNDTSQTQGNHQLTLGF